MVLIITRTATPLWLVARYNNELGCVHYYTPQSRRQPKEKAWEFEDPYEASRVVEALNEFGKLNAWFLVEKDMAR